MARPRLDLIQGTLDLMVLQTLATMGPQHGFGLARRIEQRSGDEVLLNQPRRALAIPWSPWLVAC